MAIGALAGIAAGASALSGIFKGVTGIRQQRRAERIRRRAQAEFDANPFRTPAEALQALSSAQQQAAQTRLPGQDLMEAQIQAGLGGALQTQREAATTPGEIAAGATGAYQRLYVNPLRDLGIAAAQRYDANQRNLQAQLGNISQFRTQEWQQNVLMPYQRAMQTAGQLGVAGQQNLFSGVGDVLGGVANFGLAGGFGGDVDPDTARAAAARAAMAAQGSRAIASTANYPVQTMLGSQMRLPIFTPVR